MGYRIKVQRVDRPTNRSYYVNMPVVLAGAIGLEKGEQWEWSLENKDKLIFQRVKKVNKAAKRPNPK